MHALPLFIPMAEALAYMENLHLNMHWFVVLIVTTSIVSGFLISTQNQLALLQEHKQMGRKAKTTERILGKSEAVAKSGHFSWDAESKAVFWSDQCFNIFGRDPDTWIPTGENFRQDIAERL